MATRWRAEIDCLTQAKQQTTYQDTVLYSTLMPCYLCTGAVIQFGIPKVIVGESVTFPGGEGKWGKSPGFMRAQRRGSHRSPRPRVHRDDDDVHQKQPGAVERGHQGGLIRVRDVREVSGLRNRRRCRSPLAVSRTE